MKSDLLRIKRALISVYDKKNLDYLARNLAKFKVEIISTGGTLEGIKKLKIKATSVTTFTKSPEILEGRVKTLHPKIFGAILARRQEDKKEIQKLRLNPIDLVVVNLYPFEKTVLDKNSTPQDILENIDIGGVSLIRAAVKNHNYVTVIVDPQDYESLITELEQNKGYVSFQTRLHLAEKAIRYTAYYDGIISGYFASKTCQSGELLELVNFNFRKLQDLRYGENPHQKAALYKKITDEETSLAQGRILSGKELSYNNIVDLDFCLQMIAEFEKPFAVIVKHSIPCGAASADVLAEAYQKAYDADPVSAYGCIIGLNKKVDVATAEKIDKTPFVECVIAPEYEPAALDILRQKKNRRIVACGYVTKSRPKVLEMKLISGGSLVQTPDSEDFKKEDLKAVTRTVPTEREMNDLVFAWKICKYVRSNAIVLAKDEVTVGIGAGQTSRVDSAKIAIAKAKENAKGSVMASDGFLPMVDNVELAAQAGVAAIIQPGGSKADPEVIKACDERKISMVFTGFRHFRH